MKNLIQQNRFWFLGIFLSLTLFFAFGYGISIHDYTLATLFGVSGMWLILFLTGYMVRIGNLIPFSVRNEGHLTVPTVLLCLMSIMSMLPLLHISPPGSTGYFTVVGIFFLSIACAGMGFWSAPKLGRRLIALRIQEADFATRKRCVALLHATFVDEKQRDEAGISALEEQVLSTLPLAQVRNLSRELQVLLSVMPNVGINNMAIHQAMSCIAKIQKLQRILGITPFAKDMLMPGMSTA